MIRLVGTLGAVGFMAGAVLTGYGVLLVAGVVVLFLAWSLA